METLDLLRRLSEASGVSGYESQARDLVAEELRRYSDETRIDRLGSVIARKAARGVPKPFGRVMIAAHLDEIGLIVTAQEGPFLRFSTVGGIDQRALPEQRVLVHGTEPLPGIIGTRPPHVTRSEDREKVTRVEDLVIDTGLDEATLSQRVRVGDIVSLQRQVTALHNHLVAGKALDNRASLAALILAMECLSTVDHTWDVYAIATVQEEVGLRGAATAAFGVVPDIGIAVDVSFGDASDLPPWQTTPLGSGPAIPLGPNIHPWVHEKLVKCAQEHEIPHQITAEPGDTGTDAWAIQVTRSGIPTGLLGVPLRYMHSTVETASIKDIERTSRLLAAFVSSLGEQAIGELGVKVDVRSPEGGPK